jgi:hypothetical protein
MAKAEELHPISVTGAVVQNSNSQKPTSVESDVATQIEKSLAVASIVMAPSVAKHITVAYLALE